jgi:hypothetical protein
MENEGVLSECSFRGGDYFGSGEYAPLSVAFWIMALILRRLIQFR